MSPLRHSRLRATLAKAIKHAAAAYDQQSFSVARRSEASLSRAEPLQLGTPTRAGPSRSGIDRSIQILGGSQPSWHPRSQAVVARPFRAEEIGSVLVPTSAVVRFCGGPLGVGKVCRAPLDWTVSCGGFDHLPGVVILELLDAFKPNLTRAEADIRC